MRRSFRSVSAAETIALGMRLGRLLSAGSVLLLEGPMGAGKTRFAKGVYLGLGGDDPDVVTSPTYNLQHIYEGGRLPLTHYDLYRLEKASQVEGLDADGGFVDPGGIVMIEWPELARSMVGPLEALVVTFELDASEGGRTLTFDAPGTRYAAVFAGIGP